LPIAWRPGAVSTRRVHIYWCRPLADDVEDLWVPDKTDGGAIKGPREPRLMEPGQSWVDPIRINWKHVEAQVAEVKKAAEARKALVVSGRGARTVKAQARAEEAHRAAVAAFQSPPPGMVRIIVGGQIRHVPARQ
jgi:hypothetical protein